MLSAARPVHRAAVHRVAVHRAAVRRAALRRAAALLAVTALTALPVAAPARADTPEAGRADAVTAELALDVSLLNSTVDVPVDIALNKVESPAEQHGSVLSANVAGVAQPGPVTLVKADVGSSVTHLDAQGASAAVQLLNADVHAPGLPASTLLGLRALSASVSCPVDGSPTATVNMPATLSVLGHQVSLRAIGPTHVDVPAIGSVDIEFAPRSTTSSTAAAAALGPRRVESAEPQRRQGGRHHHGGVGELRHTRCCRGSVDAGVGAGVRRLDRSGAARFRPGCSRPGARRPGCRRREPDPRRRHADPQPAPRRPSRRTRVHW